MNPIKWSSPIRSIGLITATLGLAGWVGLQGQTLVSVYKLNNTLADSRNGSTTLINNGASLGPTGLSFAPNTGPTLLTPVDLAGNYSIGLRFSFSEVNHWGKVIDYKDRISDTGQYVYETHLDFVRTPAGSVFEIGPGVVTQDTLFDFVLTRNGSTVAGYLNGSSVPEFSFADSAQDAVAVVQGGSAVFQLFQDDTEMAGEASAGLLREVRVWDGALSPADIPGAFVPEPATWLSTLALVFGPWLVLRRRGKLEG